jgi:hypothetical protein
MRADLAERQRQCLETVPHAHVRIWPQQPVLLNRGAREQGLSGQLVVQRGIRGTQRRQIADEKGIRDVSVVFGRQRRIPRVRVVPVLRRQDILAYGGLRIIRVAEKRADVDIVGIRPDVRHLDRHVAAELFSARRRATAAARVLTVEVAIVERLPGDEVTAQRCAGRRREPCAIRSHRERIDQRRDACTRIP